MKGILVKWSELDYQDDNDNLHYGLEILDDEDYSFDCYWFGTDQDRQNFIDENKIILKINLVD